MPAPRGYWKIVDGTMVWVNAAGQVAPPPANQPMPDEGTYSVGADGRVQTTANTTYGGGKSFSDASADAAGGQSGTTVTGGDTGSTGSTLPGGAEPGGSSLWGTTGYTGITPQGVSLYDYNADVTSSNANQAAARAKQDAFIQAMQAQAAGTGPSAAREQLAMAMAKNQNSLNSAAASSRGVNPALAQAIALRQGSQANQASAGEAAYIRAQEQLAAQNLLGTAIQQQRGADISQYGTASGSLNTQNANQTNLAIDQAKLAQATDQLNAAQQASIVGMTLQAIAAAGAAVGPTVAKWAADQIAAGKSPNEIPYATAPSTDNVNNTNGAQNTGDGNQTPAAAQMTGVTTNPDGSQTQTFSDGSTIIIPAPAGGQTNTGTNTGDGYQGGDTGTGGTGDGGGGGGGKPSDQHFAMGGEVFTPYGDTIWDTSAAQASPTAVKKVDFTKKVNTVKEETAGADFARDFMSVFNPIFNTAASFAGPFGSLLTSFNSLGQQAERKAEGGAVGSGSPAPSTGGNFWADMLTKLGAPQASTAPRGFSAGGQALMQQGGEVPGKAQFPGNDYRNDVVPAMLSKKEIVIPRDIAMSENAPQESAEFVAAIKGQQPQSQERVPSYSEVVQRLQELERKFGRK